LEVADPLLRLELDARLARARMRELLALAALIAQIDRLDEARGR
jgi:hypothetical protein